MPTQDLGQYIKAVRDNGIRLNANEPLIVATGGTVSLPAGTTVGGVVVQSTPITSTSAQAFAVGPNGNTNPSFNVDASAASAVTGLNVAAAASGSGVTLSPISSGANEPLVFTTKANGDFRFVQPNINGHLKLVNSTNTQITAELYNTGTDGNVAGQLVLYRGATASGTFGLTGAGALKIDSPQFITMQSAVAVPAGGSAAASVLMSTTASLGLYFGSGAPTVSAAQGSIYIRTDGSSTSTRLYVNTNGSTTWTNFTSAA